MSALSLLLCVSMLVGTTFAWFTDSVTSAGNIIQSGTLDVDMVDAAGNSMAGQVIEFVTADGRAQSEILWEPGCTYKTEPVKVVNLGNLALKYEIHINGIDGNAKLLEAIEWTVTIGGVETDLASYEGKLYPEAGKDISGEIVLSGHMKEEAGNEYQGLKAEGISIVVYATQLTHENDSFDNQYDKNAEFAATTMLNKVAAVAAGETATVKLESDGYVVINNESPIGAKVAGNVTVDLNGKTLFVKVEDGDAHKSLFNIVKGGKLTVTGNGTIEMLAGKNSLVTAIFNNTAGELVIENGTYKMDHMNNWQDALIPTLIDTNSSAGEATTTINGGNFYHTRNMFRNFSGVKSTLTINGGTFNGQADDWAAIWNQKPSASVADGKGLVNINGGTFNYVEINNEFNTGVTIGAGVVVPKKASGTSELADALSGGNQTVYLSAGTYEFPSIPAGSTIIGEEGVVFTDTLSGTLDNVTIKNVDIKAGNAQRWAYANGDLVFENCTFEATSVYAIHYDGLNGANITYKDCTIIGWAAIGGGAQYVTFDGCKIFGNGSYGLLRLYSPGTIKNCVFDVAAVNTTDVFQDGIHAVDCEIKVSNNTNVNGPVSDLYNVSGTGVITEQ